MEEGKIALRLEKLGVMVGALCCEEQMELINVPLMFLVFSLHLGFPKGSPRSFKELQSAG